jgi:hypothetical protein
MWNSLSRRRHASRHALKVNRARWPRLGVQVLENRCLPAILVVTTNVGTGAGSFPNAVTQSVAGDVITFSSALAGQPIVLATPVTINKSITIQGLGADETIFSGAGTNRLFNVTSANPVTINGVTLSNGLTVGPNTNGGAILNTGMLVLNDDTFSLNQVLGPGSEGGAIASVGTAASLTIKGCSFSGGFATGGGGVLFNDTTSTATIDTSSLESNRASANGSGIDNKGNLKITSSGFSQETAVPGGNLGGAINNQFGATITLVSCSLVGNAAIQGGGALNNDGTATIINTSIIANHVLMDGGPGGGAIRNTGTLQVFDSTFTANSDAGASATSSGNISNSGGTVLLFNTVIAEGTTGNGASPDINGAVLPQSSNNFIGAADAALTGISNGINSNQVGTVANPIFDLLGPINTNGGLTLNRVPLPGSPLINTGNKSFIPPGVNLDQRGFPRIIGGTVDIGASEFQPPQTTTNLTVAVSPPASGPQATLTATVKGPTPDSVIPSGVVSFFSGGTIVGGVLVGGTPIGTANLDAIGTATLSVTTPGNFQFAAVFTGNAPLGELGSTSQQVGAQVFLATTTNLAVSVSPPASGPLATLTATVSGPTPGSPIPSGNVTFFNGGSIVGGVLVGGTPVGTVPLGATGTAALPVTTPGSFLFTVVFNGNAALNELGSTSQQIPAQVFLATTTNLAVAVSPPSSGPLATLTATVSGVTPGSVTPSGTVTFFNGGLKVGGGLINGVPIDTVPLDATGKATLSVTTPGTYFFTAVYNGNFAQSELGSTSQQVSAQIVVPPPPRVSVAYGPAGPVYEIVDSTGLLTQIDASGSHVLSGGIRSASVAFGPAGEVLLITDQTGTLFQFDASGSRTLTGGVQDASVAFGPAGAVYVLVTTDGTLSQFDATGLHVLGSGIRSASVAFTPAGSEVLLTINSAGALTQFDSGGARQLVAGGVFSASVAFDPSGSAVYDVLFQDGSLFQFDRFGLRKVGMVA